MPSDITIFVASYLIYIDALLAAGIVAFLLYRRPRTAAVRWLVFIGITAVIAFIAAQIGAAAYSDPRPFTQDHIKPLIAHGADNGFPSDHGLLAALVVAAVLLLGLRFVAPFVVLGILVDWARIGAGLHHVIDVVGSAAFVALGLVIGYAVGSVVTRFVIDRLPDGFLDVPAHPDGRRDPASATRRDGTGVE